MIVINCRFLSCDNGAVPCEHIRGDNSEVDRASEHGTTGGRAIGDIWAVTTSLRATTGAAPDVCAMGAPHGQ